jgi:peroxiredoxin Q/BCP
MTENLKKGDKAPLFTLKNKDGKDVSLSDFKNKYIVLYFYPKDNTKGCTQEAIDFSELTDSFKQNDAVIIGISPDTEKSHTNFINKHNLKVELLSDHEHEVMEKYGVWQLKKMYGKEYMGVVRSTFLLSPDLEIIEIWDKVKVKEHAKKVFETLCSLKQ